MALRWDPRSDPQWWEGAKKVHDVIIESRQFFTVEKMKLTIPGTVAASAAMVWLGEDGEGEGARDSKREQEGEREREGERGREREGGREGERCVVALCAVCDRFFCATCHLPS